jgi:hypothetical protein
VLIGAVLIVGFPVKSPDTVNEVINYCVTSYLKKQAELNEILGLLNRRID